jgi:hypothetical protein
MSDSPDDGRIRQLMHELVDAAPRPPEWDDLAVPRLQVAEPPRRGPWLLGAAAAIVLVAAIASALAVLTRDDDQVATNAPVATAAVAPSTADVTPVSTAVAPTTVGASAVPPVTNPASSLDAADPTLASSPSTPTPATMSPPDDDGGGVELVRAYLADVAAGRFDGAAARLGASDDWRSRPDLAALTLVSDASELRVALAQWCRSGALCAAPSTVTLVADGSGGSAVSATYDVDGATVTGTFPTAEAGGVRGLPPLAAASALEVLAVAADAGTVVAATPDDVVVTWAGGRTTELGPAGDAWVRAEGEFVLWEEPVTDENGMPTPRTRATRLDGEVVCEVDGHMHRLREVAGRLVASVERADELPVPTGQDQPIPNYAIDCETGERTAIDPISWSREGGSRGILRVADRTFTYEGDSEGNADVTNEAGVSINGDDYAGYHTYSPDGDRVVYGDFTGSVSPHATDRIRSRDTTTGELLWTLDVGTPFGSLQHTGDRVVVSQAPATNGAITPWDATARIDVYDADTGEQLLSVPTVLEVVYVG